MFSCSFAIEPLITSLFVARRVWPKSGRTPEPKPKVCLESEILDLTCFVPFRLTQTECVKNIRADLWYYNCMLKSYVDQVENAVRDLNPVITATETLMSVSMKTLFSFLLMDDEN